MLLTPGIGQSTVARLRRRTASSNALTWTRQTPAERRWARYGTTRRIERSEALEILWGRLAAVTLVAESLLLRLEAPIVVDVRDRTFSPPTPSRPDTGHPLERSESVTVIDSAETESGCH